MGSIKSFAIQSVLVIAVGGYQVFKQISDRQIDPVPPVFCPSALLKDMRQDFELIL